MGDLVIPLNGLLRLLLPVGFTLIAPIVAYEFFIQKLDVLLCQLPRPLPVNVDLASLPGAAPPLEGSHLSRRHPGDLGKVLHSLLRLGVVNPVQRWPVHVVEMLVACFEWVAGEIDVLVAVLSLDNRHLAAFGIFHHGRSHPERTPTVVGGLRGPRQGTVADGVLARRKDRPSAKGVDGADALALVVRRPRCRATVSIVDEAERKRLRNLQPVGVQPLSP